MSPEALQRKLRRIFNTSAIEVKQDRAWAFRNKVHPHALQVWHTSASGPYVLAVCQRKGKPAEPDERFFASLWAMNPDRFHMSAKSFGEKIMFDARDHAEHQERETSRRFRDRIMSHKGEILSMFGRGKYWNLNRSLVPQ